MFAGGDISRAEIHEEIYRIANKMGRDGLEANGLEKET